MKNKWRILGPLGVNAVIFLVTIFACGVSDVIALIGADAPRSWEGKDFFDGSLARGIEKEFEDHSTIAEKVRPVFNEQRFLLFQEVTPKVTLGRDNWLFQTSNVVNYPRPGHEALLTRHVEGIHTVVEWFKRQGTQVLVVPLPNKWADYMDKLPEMDAPPTPMWQTIVAALRERGVWTANLKDALDPKNGPSFVANNTHWTDEACRRSAAEVVRELAARFETGLPGRPFDGAYIEEWESPWEGDLQRMLGFRPDSPAYALFNAERNRIRPVEKGTHSLGQFEGPQDIVLCGTSFSRSFDFSGMIAVEAGREVENQSISGKGPMVRLERVVDEILEGRRPSPKVLVWEFPEKHVYANASRFLHPLEALSIRLKTSGIYDESRWTALASRKIELRNLANAETPEPDTAWEGIASGNDPQVIYHVDGEIPGDGSHAISYRVKTSKRTSTQVMFDFGSGFKRRNSVRIRFAPGGDEQCIVVPIQGEPGSFLRRLRVDPVDTKTTFSFTGVRIHERM